MITERKNKIAGLRDKFEENFQMKDMKIKRWKTGGEKREREAVHVV